MYLCIYVAKKTAVLNKKYNSFKEKKFKLYINT